MTKNKKNKKSKKENQPAGQPPAAQAQAQPATKSAAAAATAPAVGKTTILTGLTNGPAQGHGTNTNSRGNVNKSITTQAGPRTITTNSCTVPLSAAIVEGGVGKLLKLDGFKVGTGTGPAASATQNMNTKLSTNIINHSKLMEICNGYKSESKIVSSLLSDKEALKFKPISVLEDNDIYNARIMDEKYAKKNLSYNSFDFVRKQYPRFSSFGMAHDCIDLMKNKLDFVGHSESIKKLLMLSISDFSASFFLHRVRDGILVDYFDLTDLLVSERLDFSYNEWKVFRDFALGLIGEDEERDKTKFDYKTDENCMYEAIHGLFYKVLDGDLKFQVQVVSDWNKTVKDRNEYFKKCLNETPATLLNTYRWKLDDYQFLVGTHVPTFKAAPKDMKLTVEPNPNISQKDKPIVFTLGIHEDDYKMSKQYGLEMWLENLMFGASGTYYCEHKSSRVQKTELLLTQDIPGRVGIPKMSTLIEVMKKQILQAIQEKVAKTGRTYWLLKRHGEEKFQIFDLTEELALVENNNQTIGGIHNPLVPCLGTLLSEKCEDRVKEVLGSSATGTRH